MSKELKALERSIKGKATNSDITLIKKALKDKEKQDHYIETLEDRLNNLETTCARKNEVLEIILSKKVDMFQLKLSGIVGAYNNYVMGRYNGDKYRLTQEEFYLLKETLL